MFLSRPSNPPYRDPTLSSSASPSPRLGPSPKRKRRPEYAAASSNSATEPAVLQNHDLAMSLEAGSDSPRARVAEKFDALAIYHSNHLDSVPHRTGAPDVSLSKGPKFHPPESSTAASNPASQAESQFFHQQKLLTPYPHHSDNTELVNSYPSDQNQPSFTSRYRSPPPDLDPHPFNTLPASPRFQPPESPSLDRAALTWQPMEITGGNIDPLCLDDDGEGINGIGFRPTPQIAEKRAQRRREQVNEWKAREAREARMKRMAMRRRRMGEDGASPRSGKAPRRVRFENVFGGEERL